MGRGPRPAPSCALRSPFQVTVNLSPPWSPWHAALAMAKLGFVWPKARARCRGGVAGQVLVVPGAPIFLFFFDRSLAWGPARLRTASQEAEVF